MDDGEIDLGRMQKLLNGFNNDISYENEVKDFTPQKKIKDNNIGIGLGMQDINYMLKANGRIGGFSNTVHAYDLYNDIVNNIPNFDIVNAKNIAFIYIVNPNISMFAIGDVMEKIHEQLLSKDIGVVFGTETNESLAVDMIEYRVIITGIEQHETTEDIFKDLESKDTDLRFHKQLYDENYHLKRKIEELENKNKTLNNYNRRLENSLLGLKK